MAVNKIRRKIKRIKKINSMMDFWSATKYIVAFFLNVHLYLKPLCKREFTIKIWNSYVIHLRMYSRDLDFFESIYIGKFVEGNYIGEYDIEVNDKRFSDIVDLGANIGLFTVLYAIRYPEKRIISFEPERTNYLLLKKNTKQFKNIKCVQAGVWYRDHMVKVYPSRVIVKRTGTSSEGAFYIGECDTNDGMNINMGYSLETIIKKNKLSDILVKMDVEGAENEIFCLGKKEWLKECQILIIETHEWLLPETKMDVVIDKCMKDLQYEKSVSGENKIYIKSDK